MKVNKYAILSLPIIGLVLWLFLRNCKNELWDTLSYDKHYSELLVYSKNDTNPIFRKWEKDVYAVLISWYETWWILCDLDKVKQGLWNKIWEKNLKIILPNWSSESKLKQKIIENLNELWPEDQFILAYVWHGCRYSGYSTIWLENWDISFFESDINSILTRINKETKKVLLIDACESWSFHNLANNNTTIVTSSDKWISSWSWFTSTSFSFWIEKVLANNPDVLAVNLESKIAEKISKRLFIDSPKVSWWTQEDQLIIDID